MKESTSFLDEKKIEFAKYFLAGGFAASVWVFVLWLCVSQFKLPEELSSFIGFTFAVIVNYKLQHKYVFQMEGNHFNLFKKFVVVNIFTQVLNIIIYWYLINVLSIQYIIAQIFVIGLIFVINFLINRNYTFKK